MNVAVTDNIKKTKSMKNWLQKLILRYQVPLY